MHFYDQSKYKNLVFSLFSISLHKSMCHSKEALWNVLYMLYRAAFPGINWQRF